MTHIFYEAAIRFAEQGARVFPVAPKQKTPLTSNGFKGASNDLKTIESWWRKWPDANIGIATGADSGVWVLDIDGAEGEASLKALEQKHGSISQTVEVISGGGGRHLYFKMPDGYDIRSSASTVGDKIDVRGTGGYIIAPPSIHPSGRSYEWSVDSADDFIDAPDWLLKLVVQRPSYKRAQSQADWKKLLQGVSEGSRNQSAARLAGKLFRHRLDSEFVLYLLASWNDSRCKPPLSNDELYNVFISIAKAEARNREVV